jgi:hypothetical protein
MQDRHPPTNSATFLLTSPIYFRRSSDRVPWMHQWSILYTAPSATAHSIPSCPGPCERSPQRERFRSRRRFRRRFLFRCGLLFLLFGCGCCGGQVNGLGLRFHLSIRFSHCLVRRFPFLNRRGAFSGDRLFLIVTLFQQCLDLSQRVSLTQSFRPLQLVLFDGNEIGFAGSGRLLFHGLRRTGNWNAQ